jgi:hypothetical protein
MRVHEAPLLIGLVTSEIHSYTASLQLLEKLSKVSRSAGGTQAPQTAATAGSEIAVTAAALLQLLFQLLLLLLLQPLRMLVSLCGLGGRLVLLGPAKTENSSGGSSKDSSGQSCPHFNC